MIEISLQPNGRMESRTIRRIGATIISALLIVLASVLDATVADPGSNVDCNAVMNEVHSGKYERQVSKDLKMPLYEIRRCKQLAKESARAANRSSLEARSGRETHPAHLPVLRSPSPAAVSSPH